MREGCLGQQGARGGLHRFMNTFNSLEQIERSAFSSLIF